MLPSLSSEFRLPVGVDREFFSSRTRAAALWIDDPPEDGGPSRLASDLSWFFFDLNRKAMVSSWGPLRGDSVVGLAADCSSAVMLDGLRSHRLAVATRSIDRGSVGGRGSVQEREDDV